MKSNKPTNSITEIALHQIEESIQIADVPISITGAGSMFRLHLQEKKPTCYREAYHTDEKKSIIKELLDYLFLEEEIIMINTFKKRLFTTGSDLIYKKLKENIFNFKKNFNTFSPLICFAVKSNTNVNLIKEIQKFGLGADVVSMGELMMALKAGINPKKIVFSGVGKTSDEISYAIDKKILLINAESQSEIKEIDRIAKIKKKKIQIGIRLNPNTDAKTLSHISTGKKENKFGVNEKTFLELFNYCKNSKNISLICPHVISKARKLLEKYKTEVKTMLDFNT